HKWLILLVWLVIGACGDVNNVKGNSKQLFEELCDSAFRCCSRGEVDDLLGPFVDEENCSARLSQLASTRSGFIPYTLPLQDFGFLLPNTKILGRASEGERANFVGSAVD